MSAVVPKAWLLLLLVSAFLELRFGHDYFSRSQPAARAIEYQSSVTKGKSDDTNKILHLRGSSSESRQDDAAAAGAILLQRTRDDLLGNITTQPSAMDPFSSTHGGIFYFLHIPKVGGTTIRDYFAKHADQLLVIRNRGQLMVQLPQITEWATNGTNGKVIAIETHTNDIPAWNNDLHRYVQQWKEEAKQHQVSFFAFTLLREPLSFVMSAFNYYYLSPHHNKTSGTTYQLADATPNEVVDTLLYNPQCSFLSRGGFSYAMLDGGIRHEYNRARLNQEQTRDDCDASYQTLFQTMDWVGTTDRLVPETLAIIDYLLSERTVAAISATDTNAAAASGTTDNKNATPTTTAHASANQNTNKQVTLAQLDSAQLKFIQEHTSHDDEWYRLTKERYSYDELWKHRIKDAATPVDPVGR